MATEIKVGLGNVGKGTYDILKRNHSLIRQRAGAPISVKRVTVRNVDRVKLLVDEDVIVTNDWHDLVNDPEVNVVVEAMGACKIFDFGRYRRRQACRDRKQSFAGRTRQRDFLCRSDQRRQCRL